MKNKMKRKDNFFLLFLLTFIIISMLVVRPDDKKEYETGFTSEELKIKEKTDSELITYTYINSSGENTVAIDKGYAIREQLKNINGQIIRENYYDADGNPVKLYDSYYGLSYEYKDHEQIIQYLDSKGNVIQLSTGYSTIIRSLDDTGRAIDDFYYDMHMKPVSYLGTYGFHRDYDEQGKNSKITYLDKNGEPVISSLGYAAKEYQYDDEGNVVGEFYFDTQGNPAKSSLGEYGQLYERDVQNYISQIVYLNAEKNPAPTNAGYTILRRTYYRDGTVDTDKYFDSNGNPIALSKGQYGIKHSGKITLLLNKNGYTKICVDNILNGFPFMVIVFGCVICLCMLFLPEKMSVFLTLIYVLFILYETLMFREVGEARINLVPFSYAGKFFKEQTIRIGVINNIWLFVPLGTGVYRRFRNKWVLLVPFFMSVAIETTQYITGLGIAEFDDVFGNTLGGWIGILLVKTMISYKKERRLNY